MPTVADLAARDYREYAYLLAIEGVPFMFTDRAEIAGSGASSWIGTANGERRVLEGLTVPAEISFSTSLETGMLESDDGVTFTIQDFDGEIIEFLREQTEAETVSQSLTPKDNPAPSELISGDAQTNISIWGKWVGREAIGEKGQRNAFQCFPGDPMPGLSHAAYAGDLQYLAPSVVYDSPAFLGGRRCALYRIFKDTSSTATNYSAWPSWSDQFASGESLVWVGTLVTPTAEARTWKLSADGPSSWLRKQLNATRPDTWEGVYTTLTLNTTPGAREDLISLEFIQSEGGGGTVYVGGRTYFDEVLDVLPATGNPDDYRVAIANRVATVSAAVGDDITWTISYDSSVEFKQGYISTKTGDFGFCAVWSLTAHEKVWRTLGFDPVLQKAVNYETEYEIDFTGSYDGKMIAQYSPTSEPAPGYYTGVFNTLPLGEKSIKASNAGADNGGEARVVRALYPFGPMLLQPGAQQEIVVGLGSSTPYIEGQLNRPPAEHEFSNNGGAADSTGYFAFRASYRESIDDEPIKMVQVAKCSWRNDSGTYGINDLSQRQLFIERFLDPRWFGTDRKPLDKVWSSVDLEVIPFALLGYNLNYGDLSWAVLLRTMLSSGTAEFTGFEGQNPTRTLGVNAHPDATAEASDVELADLGLAIPHTLIDAKSFVKAASQVPDALVRCKYGFIGSFDSQELIARILAPRGWGLGIVRGQFRLFSMSRTLTHEDAEVVIGPDDFASDDQMFVERVNLRPLTAKDKFAVTYGKALVDEAASEREMVERVRAQDVGSRTRHSNAEQEIDGFGLIPIPLWKGANDAPPQWANAWAQLWANTIANWYGSAQVMVEDVPLQWSKARHLGPGSIVRFSSYFGPGREGVYGLTNRVGLVTKVVLDLHGLTARVSILLQPGDATQARRFAPIAMVLDNVSTVQERYDAATRTFHCYANYFQTEDEDAHDVRYFADWLGVGGDAVVNGWQFDGRQWSLNFSFVVESVSVAGDSITHKPGSMTGTWKEGQPTILVLAPYDDQPAESWPRAMFAVITRSDFKFGAGPTKGFKLV